jgi:hypothetical protein
MNFNNTNAGINSNSSNGQGHASRLNDSALQDVLITSPWTDSVLDLQFNYMIEGETISIYFEDNSVNHTEAHVSHMKSIISEIDDVIDLDFEFTDDFRTSDIDVFLDDRTSQAYLGKATTQEDAAEGRGWITLEALWETADSYHSNLNTFTHEFMHALGIGDTDYDARWDQDDTVMSYNSGDSIEFRSSPNKNDFQALLSLWGHEDDSDQAVDGSNNLDNLVVEELPVIQPAPVFEESAQPAVESLRIEVPIVFSEGFDSVTGFNENVPLASQVASLYLAAFERFGEFEGLKYWFDIAKALDITNIAHEFVNSQEFSDTYGELTNLGFIDEMYNNVLGRSGDSAGTEFWKNQLDTNTLSRAEILVGFSESTENQALFNSLF